MVKRVFILFMLMINTLLGFSARNEVHKYGSVTLGEDISGLSYNPATLFNLSKSLGQIALSTSEKFTFSSFYMGYYLTRFPCLSQYYWTSLNIGLGMEKKDHYEQFLIGIGGTLIRFLKYGLSYKYVIIDKDGKKIKFSDFDMGFLLRILKWWDLGASLKNATDHNLLPMTINMGSTLKVTDDIKFLTGLLLPKDMSDITDYSLSFDINLIKGLYMLAGLQKEYLVPGLGYNFNYDLENIYLSSRWDKEKKRFTLLILSYYHRFPNLFYSSEKGEKEKETIMEGDDEEKVMSKKDILKDQKFYLEKAKFYYAQQRIEDSKEMLYKVIELDKNSKYGKEALAMLNRIKKMERKLKAQ
ncbi:MAG: hypothetical protein JW827_03165 [Spirochaetes bacterium]|nr:hypothetical protein [Spirochaetota bacterium]